MKKEGYYGFLHVYGDDSLTDIDEGAVAGDKITFKIFDLSENKEKQAFANNETTWNAYETKRIDLQA